MGLSSSVRIPMMCSSILAQYQHVTNRQMERCKELIHQYMPPAASKHQRH